MSELLFVANRNMALHLPALDCSRGRSFNKVAFTYRRPHIEYEVLVVIKNGNSQSSTMKEVFAIDNT
jgi:hypothetical protein